MNFVRRPKYVCVLSVICPECGPRDAGDWTNYGTLPVVVEFEIYVKDARCIHHPRTRILFELEVA